MDSKNSNYKSVRRKLAASGGLVMGAVLYLDLLANYLAQNNKTILFFISIVSLTAIFSVMSLFVRRLMAIDTNRECGYGSRFGFILQLMAFSGLIYGTFYFLQINVIDPSYYSGLFSQIVDVYIQGLNEVNSEVLAQYSEEQLRTMIGGLIENPLVVILSATFSTLIYGALVGLVIAALAKKPKIKSEE